MSEDAGRGLDRDIEEVLQSREFTERLLEVAVSGGAKMDIFETEVGDVPLGEPINGTLRDAVQSARAAARVGDSAGSVGALAELAEGGRRAGAFEVAAAICGEARDLVIGMGSQVQGGDLSYLENVTGLIAFEAERLEIAERAFRAGVDLARRAGSPHLLGMTLLNLSNVRGRQRALDEARLLAVESLRAYTEADDRHGQAKLLLTLATIAMEQGDSSVAEANLVEATPIINKLRDPGLTASHHATLGRLLAARGTFKEAELEFQKALRAARRSGELHKEASALQDLAAVASDRGLPALTRRRLISATNFAAARRLTQHLRVLLGSLARAEHRAGHSAAALTYASQAVQLADVTGEGVTDARALLGAALLDNDRLDEALATFRLALQAVAASNRADEISIENLEATLHNLLLVHQRLGSLADAELELRIFLELIPARAQAELLEHLAVGLHTAGSDPAQIIKLLEESVELRPPGERAWACLVSAAQLDKGAASERLLRIAIASAEAEGQEHLVGQARNDLALVVAADGLASDAISLLEGNAAAAEAADDRVSLQLALNNLAEMYRRVDRIEDAEHAARRSVGLAEQLGDLHALAGSQVQLGLVLSDIEKFDAATLAFNAAQDAAPGDRSIVAAALSGLAGIALGSGKADDAVALYRKSLSLDVEDDLHTLERLLGLCEALTAAGNRRAFTIALQRVVDLVQKDVGGERPFVGLLRSARRWADRGQLRLAGEVLAVMALIGTLDWSEDDGASEAPVGKSRLFLGVGLIGFELNREVSLDLNVEITRRAIKRELGRHLDPDATDVLMNLVNEAALALHESPVHEDPDDYRHSTRSSE